MNARLLWIPVALLAAGAFVATDDAEASPLKAIQRAAQDGTTFGPRISIGARIGVPISHRRHRHHAHRSGGYYREEVSFAGGYHVNRTREVEVPGRQIGYDFEGQAIYAASTVQLQTYRVWIPRKRIVRRVWVPTRVVHHRRSHRRSHGHISIGGRFRIR